MNAASPGNHAQRCSFISLLLNTAATVQLVWLYLARVPSAMSLLAYEKGRERTPFQQRMLLMLPLRYAHQSRFFAEIAAFLNRAHGWFGVYSGHITPEGILQAALDLSCVLLTGMVARKIYRAASPTGLLIPIVYPLVLVMITVTYCIQVNHPLRFLYDFPALAFFAIGLYLLYFRRSLWFFTGLFVVATINRETTLLLLPAYWLMQCMPRKDLAVEGNCTRPTCETGDGPSGKWRWAELWTPQTLAVTIPLLVWWIGWHIWVGHRFAANPSAAGPRLLLNLCTLLIPLSWPQLFSVAAYLWPLPWIYRGKITDPTLRAWVVLPIVWLGFMLFYGLLIESRIFGELISYFACTILLIAEDSVLQKSGVKEAVLRLSD